MTTKKELRQMLRHRKEHISCTEASAVLSRLRLHPRWQSASTVLLYHALPDEVPTQALLEELRAAGKTVLLPRVTSPTEMTLHRYTGPGDLQTGAYGIMEPTGEPFSDYAHIDTVLVPGMAFDRHGHRLGRGKGYYDRLLPQLPHAYKMGICFPFQLLDEVPVDDHDVLMDCVVC